MFEMHYIFDWIRDGADKKTYTSSIEAIVADNCLACHDGSNPHLSGLCGARVS